MFDALAPSVELGDVSIVDAEARRDGIEQELERCIQIES